MVVNVISLLNNNMLRATGNDWAGLYRKVEEIREQLPVEEELVLDFNNVSVSFSEETLFASNIVTMPNTKLILYNSDDICDTFKTIAIISGKDASCIESVKKNIGSLTTKPLSPSEKRKKDEKDAMKKFLSSVAVAGGVMKVNMESWTDCPFTSIRSFERGINFVNATQECVQAKLDNGENINKFIVNVGRFDIATATLDALADSAPFFRVRNIELIINIDNDAEEQQRLRLRTEIGSATMDDAQKNELIKRLGLGCVGVLTKFKNRRSDNMERRLENEITNQYIAIITGIGQKKVRLSCFTVSEMQSKWDLYMSCGDLINMRPEPRVKEINLSELGLEHACVGKLWHFNRFDGAADGIKTKKTYTTDDGCCGENLVEVPYPEYIRRVLLSHNIKFNNEKLKENVEQFVLDSKQNAQDRVK